jgi:hypothetical protein
MRVRSSPVSGTMFEQKSVKLGAEAQSERSGLGGSTAADIFEKTYFITQWLAIVNPTALYIDHLAKLRSDLDQLRSLRHGER